MYMVVELHHQGGREIGNNRALLGQHSRGKPLLIITVTEFNIYLYALPLTLRCDDDVTLYSTNRCIITNIFTRMSVYLEMSRLIIIFIISIFSFYDKVQLKSR